MSLKRGRSPVGAGFECECGRERSCTLERKHYRQAECTVIYSTNDHCQSLGRTQSDFRESLRKSVLSFFSLLF